MRQNLLSSQANQIGMFHYMCACSCAYVYVPRAFEEAYVTCEIVCARVRACVSV